MTGLPWPSLVAGAVLVVSLLLLGLLVMLRARPQTSADRRPSHADLLLEARRARLAAAARAAYGDGPGAGGGAGPSRRPRGTAAAEERLRELETQLRLLAQRQDQAELRQPGRSPYRLAINLARGGADVQEIAANCGLSRGEAELIAILHGRRNAGAASLTAGAR